MYNRPEQVLENYELEIKSVARGRGVYLCETNAGPKMLKEYRGSDEKAEFLADMLDFLKQNGLETQRIMRTKEGKIAAVDAEEKRYLLLDAFQGAECDPRNRDDIMRGAAALASLHNISKRYPGNIPEFVRAEKDSLLKLYEKHNRELNKVKNYVKTKKKKNEFEVKFTEQYPHFAEAAQAITQELKAQEIGEEAFGFCHGDFNQHNLIYRKEKTAIVGFDSFSYQMQVGDMANFMRKMLEKHNWNTGLGFEIICSYDNVKKLSKEELRLLYCHLAYPEKFWKLANHYYNSHKAWLSGRNIEKLEKVIAQEETRTQFLQMLYHFTR